MHITSRSMVRLATTWIVAASLTGCSASPRSPESATTPGASSSAATPLASAVEAVAAGQAILVDVREADEVARGMAQSAVWMPTSGIRDGAAPWERFVEGLPRERPVYLYCESGGRSDWAAGRLRARGIEARNIGGLSDWVKAGGPVRTPARGELEAGR